MPPEWAEHEATWIAWPHEPTDWLEKTPAIEWVYTEIVRWLSFSERTEILCKDEALLERASFCLEKARVPKSGYRLHVLANDRSWLRDSAPTAVWNGSSVEWVRWKFRAWAKYDNFSADQKVPDLVAKVSGMAIHDALRPDTREPLTLEGGAIETDGEGTMLTTEECLLSTEQERNPGMGARDYEAAFAEYLGIKKTIWLGRGCAGDDTHGHIDDIARFVAPGKVVLAYEADPTDDNHEASEDNYQRLSAATDAAGRKLEVIKLPMPRPIWFGDERLPGSYANFYIGNKVVVVPTFNDPADASVLQTLQGVFPGRTVVGIHAVDLVMGQGTLHCLTQQQPKVRKS